MFALAFLAGIAVCPVARGRRRVEADKGQAKFAAAQGGLLHISHSFLTALDLVGFLKPQDANVPKWQLDGFDFLWVIQSSEQNALPRRQIDALQRALCAAELGGKPQFVDGPKDLCIHTVPHRVANLACHQRMAVRVF